jgi:hypothetical protein
MILFFKLYLTVHLYLYSIQDGQQCINVGKLISALEFGKTSIIFSFWKSVFFFTNNHTFSSIFTHKKPPWSWSLTYAGFDIQYFISNLLIASFFKMVETLRAEIRWFHWNQGEKVTHFAWFGEPWHVHNLSGALSYNINFYYYWWNSSCLQQLIHLFQKHGLILPCLDFSGM